MRTTMMTIALTAAVFAIVTQESESVGSLKKIFEKEPKKDVTQENLEFGQKVVEFENAIQKFQDDVKVLCDRTPSSPWCEYKRSLLRGGHAKKRSVQQSCWPGILVCKTIMADVKRMPLKIPKLSKNLPRSAGRCRPGVAHCPSEKREFKEAKPKFKPHCQAGWPWCNY